MATVNTLALTTVLVFLCLRYCYDPIPIKTLAKWALSKFDRVLSRIVAGPPINTSNNAAYEDVDLNRGGQNAVALGPLETCSKDFHNFKGLKVST